MRAPLLLLAALLACGESSQTPAGRSEGAARPGLAPDVRALPGEDTTANVDTLPLQPIPRVARAAIRIAALPEPGVTVDTLRDTTRVAGYVIVTRTLRRTTVTVTTLGVDTIVRPPPPVVLRGVPISASFMAIRDRPELPIQARVLGTTPDSILSLIAQARAAKIRLSINFMGGAHSPQAPGRFLTMVNGVLAFDRAKWSAVAARYNTPEIRDAVAACVAEGICLDASVMDEPNVSGHGDGNTWGPRGTMTKARVDSLCGELKAAVPGIPVGVVHRHDVFEADRAYRVCDFVRSQYSARAGTLQAFVSGALALARRDGHGIAFAFNNRNGGDQDPEGRRGGWDCVGQGGYKGQLAPNCAMTPAQIKTTLLTLGAATHGTVNMWRYDANQFRQPGVIDSLRVAADSLAKLPFTPLRRR